MKTYTVDELIELAQKPEKDDDTDYPWAYYGCPVCGGVTGFLDWLKKQEKEGRE